MILFCIDLSTVLPFFKKRNPTMDVADLTTLPVIYYTIQISSTIAKLNEVDRVSTFEKSPIYKLLVTRSLIFH